MLRFELRRTPGYEGWLVNQFDRVLVTAKADSQALGNLAVHSGSRPSGAGHSAVEKRGCETITVLPNGVDLDYFSRVDEPREPATLVFTGKMSYHANVTAVLHLVQEIMPQVWAERPDVQLVIVGQNPTPEIRALKWHKHRASGKDNGHYQSGRGPVVVTGTVPDIRPYLRGSTLAVVPLLYGAGIQNKVLEAMACGTPVVASPRAISALSVQPGRDLLVADGAKAFAQAVLSLLEDRSRQAALSQAGRSYVETHHSWDGVAARLERIYETTIRNC